MQGIESLSEKGHFLDIIISIYIRGHFLDERKRPNPVGKKKEMMTKPELFFPTLTPVKNQ